eukprot:2559124-Prymnesium_polylepis.1
MSANLCARACGEGTLCEIESGERKFWLGLGLGMGGSACRQGEGGSHSSGRSSGRCGRGQGIGWRPHTGRAPTISCGVTEVYSNISDVLP